MTSQLPTNRLLVVISAVYAVSGLALLFVPELILAQATAVVPPIAVWLIGILGGALIALALLNWFQRHTMMGGIYGRPLLLANLMLTTNVAFSSLRMWRDQHAMAYAIIGLVAVVFVVAFGRLLFGKPAALRD